MNFFVGCGEVRLCLLLYVIVLIMLNNFFQNASLVYRRLFMGKIMGPGITSLIETERKRMSNTLL